MCRLNAPNKHSISQPRSVTRTGRTKPFMSGGTFSVGPWRDQGEVGMERTGRRKETDSAPCA